MKNNDISPIEDDIIVKIMKDHPDLYDMLSYNEYDIKDKLEKNAYHYEQFRMLYLQEKHKLHRISILMDEYIGKLYKELKDGDKKLSKTEIERYYIPSDEKAIKFKKLHMVQSIRCDVYEYIADAFKQQGYAMANYIKNMQL